MKKILVRAALGVIVVLALSSSAYAGSRYLITSTKQIAPSVLRKLHGARGTTGPQGAPGSQGATGASGVSVGLSSLVFYEGPTDYMGEEVGESVATCPVGQHVVSGGAVAITIYGVAASFPSADHLSWITLAIGSSPTSRLTSYVTCAASGAAVIAGKNTKAHARAVAEAKKRAVELSSQR